MKKSHSLVKIVLFFALLLSACSKPAEENNQQQGRGDNGNSTLNAVGATYMDPNIDLIISIKGGDWVYMKEDEENAVFFFLEEYPTWDNSLKISSSPIFVDADQQMLEYWEYNKQRLIDEFNLQLISEQEITVGLSHIGKMYQYTLDFDDYQVLSYYCTWYVGDKLYIITSISDSQHEKIVKEAVDSILSSFQTYAEANG